MVVEVRQSNGSYTRSFASGTQLPALPRLQPLGGWYVGSFPVPLILGHSFVVNYPPFSKVSPNNEHVPLSFSASWTDFEIIVVVESWE